MEVQFISLLLILFIHNDPSISITHSLFTNNTAMYGSDFCLHHTHNTPANPFSFSLSYNREKYTSGFYDGSYYTPMPWIISVTYEEEHDNNNKHSTPLQSSFFYPSNDVNEDEEDISECADYNHSLPTKYVSPSSSSSSDCSNDVCQSIAAANSNFSSTTSNGVIVLYPGTHTNTKSVYLLNVTRTIVSSSCSTQDTILSVNSLTAHLFWCYADEFSILIGTNMQYNAILFCIPPLSH